MKSLPLALAVLVALPVAAFAGPPSDAVRFFYSPPTYEPSPKLRDRFVDPAKAKFAENDKTPDGDIGCIDAVLAIDAQDYDEAAIKKTLKLQEKVSGDRATVTATLNIFDGPDAKREIVWSLRKVGGKWKISDIESKTNGWKLSEFDCP